MKDEMGIDLRDYEINFNQWKKFNEMRNENNPLSTIIKMRDIEVEPKLTVYFMESARNCIIKYNGDTKKVLECLEGRTNPE